MIGGVDGSAGGIAVSIRCHAACNQGGELRWGKAAGQILLRTAWPYSKAQIFTKVVAACFTET